MPELEGTERVVIYAIDGDELDVSKWFESCLLRPNGPIADREVKLADSYVPLRDFRGPLVLEFAEYRGDEWEEQWATCHAWLRRRFEEGKPLSINCYRAHSFTEVINAYVTGFQIAVDLGVKAQRMTLDLAATQVIEGTEVRSGS